MNPACYLAQHGVHESGSMPPCDGQLIRAHLIPRQLLKREGLDHEDPRTWVLACGGPMGNAGHHGMLDQSRRIRLPRRAIPPLTEAFARAHDLTWFLDREYGQR
jgi:hypothetical protein